MLLLLAFTIVSVAATTGAIFVDRVNFPQKHFIPKTLEGEIEVDRVGAHILPEDYFD